MAVDEEVPLDDKAKRMRDLLSSFYSPDPSSSIASNPASSTKFITLDDINTPSFDADQYMNLLIHKSNLEGLLQKHVEMAAEIKNLDTDLQMLVYENYNKFISATDTIKRMKNNIVGMEANMEQLLEKIMSVQSKSDLVNTSLFGKREHIEKLHRTRNLLRKVQFIYDLPTRLGKCIKTEAYADAVRFFTGAMPIFKAYGESSFQDCKRESEEAIAIIITNLQAKLFSDSEPIEVRAEAAKLLKQLNVPVDSLKDKLLENLEHFLVDLQLKAISIETTPLESDELAKQGKSSNLVPVIPFESSKASLHEFVDAVRAYRVIFPESQKKLIELARDLFTKHFETIQQRIKKKISSGCLLEMLRVIWEDVITMDEVLPEASLPSLSLEAAHSSVKQYIANTFSYLLQDVSENLVSIQKKPKEGMEEKSSLQVALEGSKKAVIQGSMDVLLDFRKLLDDSLGLLVKLRDFIVDWVQEGFQNFFGTLDNHFVLLSGRYYLTSQDQDALEGLRGEKVSSGLVLVLAQLSVFIEQSAVPRITEEIATSFSRGGVRGYEHGPAFIPGEICRLFRSSGEKFLHLYVNMKSQKLSNLLRKRFTTPNWVKHKEPREVHMFVDLLLQELEAAGTETIQILSHGAIRKHRRSDSNGSTTSSRSNPMREDRINRSNAQRARSQYLETHLAKLFKQKIEIFTKIEYTRESVISTIVKLCLKSLQEFVRLQTFNRSGFQQIQLDIQYLRTPLKEIAEDEASIDFLLDEVIVACAERCLDPTPLEPAILDKLIQAKLAKASEHNSSS
ncbi:Vacuolar protein sorting-associated protein 51-like protein [Thalictrum thalictroides]|uniref:Vacuolar protein sorting-associated protein 51 homolog n=1 Tax=Thalictrum thalictroides TaxID=46969 RepID=A0A7J6VIR4_THATH|nr:Vacuolar protein sorting-associated protein 51-like protein [Thalictrum thalictroides]